MFGKTCLEKRVKMRALRQEENGAAAPAPAATTIPEQLSALMKLPGFKPGSQIAFKSLDELLGDCDFSKTHFHFDLKSALL